MAVPRDFNWITKRYSELQQKYPNQYVAVKNGKVIAHGRDFGKVYYKAKRETRKNFVTEYILAGQPFVFDTLPQDFPLYPEA